MGVYVDASMHKYGRMVMCHMLADTSEELFEMALRIGVSVRHVQHAGTPKEHFDICKEMRQRAVVLGAKPLGRREMVALLRKKRQA